METCAYDIENKIEANHYCCECGLPLCNFCGYIIPEYSIAEINGKEKREHEHFCNSCFIKKCPQ